MNNRNFRKMLETQWAMGNFVCVGLDSEFEKLPEFLRKDVTSSAILRFNTAIVDTTNDLVCAYKPNIAFYEAHGEGGLKILRETIQHINKVSPDVPVILDAKRADIGNTNAGYVKMAFDYLKVDAITVSPYLGGEALKPFLDQGDKGIIVLCRTSNPGAGEFQDLHTLTRDPRDKPEGLTASDWLQILCNDSMRLYERGALNIAMNWNKNGNCAVVVGATYPEELREVRRIVDDMPILIPAVGFQQKDIPLEKQVEQVVSVGKNSRRQGMIINSARGIIFASSGPDFAEAARKETQKLHDLINQYR